MRLYFFLSVNLYPSHVLICPRYHIRHPKFSETKKDARLPRTRQTLNLNPDEIQTETQ